MKFIILSFVLCSTVAWPIPNPYSLKPIHHIEQAEGVTLVKDYSDLEDTTSYGNRPNCYDDSYLKTLNNVVDWNNPDSYQIKSKKKLYVSRIANGYIASSYLGTMFDDRQQFLFDIMTSPGYPIFWPVQGEVAHAPLRHYPKLAMVQGPTLFYHWVLDRMPSILLLRQTLCDNPDIQLVIGNQFGTVSGYVREYLDLLGIPAHQYIVGERGCVYYGNEVYFATPFLMEPIPNKLLMWMRQELIDAAYKKPTTREYKDNLIVVIERVEPDRRISNLSALKELLAKIFPSPQYEHITYGAGMSVAEQIKIFNNAKVVIGAMASGLTNIIYTKPGTAILEIHPSQMQHVTNKDGINNGGNEWAWWLSSAVGAEYHLIPSPFQLSDFYVGCPLYLVEPILTKYAQTLENKLTP
ncbi:hypothetical protein Noda2021_01580 [Candidatus Dependentiae bacterium Noda2021]|nr:hypothetical protein Noda2021_01580 [Candidatus Dependentiae bacterium Noda2021]